jgi:predicted DsbA family dithiol-disulfide isomerase
MAQSLMAQVQVDVVSDVICPWCFLGKRRLDKAIAMVPDIEVEVVYRPFFLDPTIPAEGMDRYKYMADKFGEERLKTIHDPLIAAGKEDGVPFQFDKITRTPNSFDAHRLLRWSMLVRKQSDVKEALFMAYWNEGRDIGSSIVLSSIAAKHGMDPEQVMADLATDKDAKAVIGEVSQSQSMGITGVPTFVLARKFGVVGAQSAEVLVDAIRKAAGQSS